MSADARLASVLILFHLVAISLAALPEPRLLQDDEGRSIDEPTPAPLPTIARLRDRAAAAQARFETAVTRSTAPVRKITRVYGSAGVPQNWRMFAAPSTEDRFLRADYHFGAGPIPDRMVRRLELPRLPEDRFRLVYQSRDKALNRAVDGYLAAVEQRPAERESLADAWLDPVVRHLRTRLRADGLLQSDGQLTRIEIRIGFAPNPPLGAPVDADLYRERLATLERYRRGVVIASPVPVRESLGSTETDADITWLLVHVAEP
jgi:hypothetical protein